MNLKGEKTPTSKLYKPKVHSHGFVEGVWTCAELYATFLQNCRKPFIVLWLFEPLRPFMSLVPLWNVDVWICQSLVTLSLGESHPQASAFDTHDEQCNLHSLQQSLSTFYEASRCSVSSSWVCTRCVRAQHWAVGLVCSGHHTYKMYGVQICYSATEAWRHYICIRRC